MNRFRSVLLAVLTLFLLSTLAFAATRWGTYSGLPVARVMLNGQVLSFDVPAVILDGRTLVPLRFVSEALGAQVAWDEANATAVINTGSTAASAGLIRTLLATERADGVPAKTGEEFSINSAAALYFYFEAWDDGKNHTWRVQWLSSQGRVYKDATVEPTRVAAGDVPARLYGYSELRLQVPVARDQALLPDAGVFYVKLLRDGVEVARVPFWLTR